MKVKMTKKNDPIINRPRNRQGQKNTKYGMCR